MFAQLKIIYGRALAVMRLDEKIIDEIHADNRASYQAVVVVYISALAVAVHIEGGWLLTAIIVPARFFVWWLLGAYIIYFIGTRFLGTKGSLPLSFGPFARGIGFAMAPRVFQIFVFFGPVGVIVQWISITWMFAAIVASTRLALGQPSYTRLTIVIGMAMLPLILLEPFILGQR